MSDFLPEDYQEPNSQNNYFKLADGENRIRILSKPIFGYEDWKDNKPVRFTMLQKPDKPFDENRPVKHFWAMIVWNYNEKEIQIMHITQVSIRKKLQELCQDKDWGNPYDYDIKINKTGEKMETKYSINPVPHKAADPAILEAYRNKPCYLDAIFDGEDPFSPKHKHWTPCAVQQELSADIKEMIAHFNECSPEYKKNLLDTLARMNPPIKRLEDIPNKIVGRIKEAIEKNRAEHLAQRAA